MSRPFDALEAPYRLETTIRSFQISLTPQPTAVVEFAARILGDKGKVLDARIFKASVPAKDTKASEAVAALDEAFGKAAAELVAWSVEKLAAVPAGDDHDKPGADKGDMESRTMTSPCQSRRAACLTSRCRPRPNSGEARQADGLYCVQLTDRCLIIRLTRLVAAVKLLDPFRWACAGAARPDLESFAFNTLERRQGTGTGLAEV